MTFEEKLRTMVNECLAEVIAEKRLEKKMRQIVNEEIKSYLTGKAINEEVDDSKRMDMKRNAVMTSLKQDILNHAPLAYELYPSADESEKATARSLFSKKATGTPDADGQVRHFSDEEINKIYNMIRTRK